MVLQLGGYTLFGAALGGGVANLGTLAATGAAFVGNQALGADGTTGLSFPNIVFPGMALALVGIVLLSRVKRASVPAKVVAALLFAFVAVSLVYACVNLRVGVKPY